MHLLLSCLGRRGYMTEFFRGSGYAGRFIATSNSVHTPSFFDCDVNHVMPDIRADVYVGEVLHLCTTYRPLALLSFFDPDIHRLAPHAEAIRKTGTIPMLPDEKVCRTCDDKIGTYRLLAAHGIATPATFTGLPEAMDAISRGELRLPVLLKPRRGFASLNVFIAHNAQQMEAFFHYAPDMVVQELLPDPEFNIDLLMDPDGVVVSLVVEEKIGMRAGETDQAVTVKNDRLTELGVKVAGLFPYFGAMDIDLFMRDGEPFVIDVNPRFGGAYPCAHLAGADFTGKILRMLKGERVAPDLGNYREGVRMMKSSTFHNGIPTGVITMRP